MTKNTPKISEHTNDEHLALALIEQRGVKWFLDNIEATLNGVWLADLDDDEQSACKSAARHVAQAHDAYDREIRRSVTPKRPPIKFRNHR